MSPARKITLDDPEQVIGAEFIANPTASEEGYVQIGANIEEPESEFFVRARDPKLYDRTHGRIVDEYQSIFHYIVVMEEDY